MEIKKNDAVMIIAGKDKGKSGTVLAVSPSKNRIVVEGVNIASKHQRARKADEKSGIVTSPAPIDASNAMIICPVCLKATRIEHKEEEGKKARFCKKCGANIDAAAKSGKSTVKKAKKSTATKKKAKAESEDAE